MHELGIMMEVVRQVEAVAKREGIKKVERIVLQIGEVASVLPHFVRECFPAATYKSSLVETELDIELLPALGRCCSCGAEYGLRPAQGSCPHCQARAYTLIQGREFIIKEIVVKEEEENE